MPVVIAPLAPSSSSVAAPDPRAERVGDPVCVAFTGASGPFRHAGTRIVEVDLAPSLAAVATSAPTRASAAGVLPHVA